MVPERLVVVDHVTRITTVVILAPATREGYEGAVSLLADTARRTAHPWRTTRLRRLMLHGSIRSSLTEEAYCRAVERAKEAVIDGDIFQVVLSQRLTAPYHGDALGLYRTLRNENPSPYLFLLDCGPFQLVGSSPETLVRLEDGTAEVRPLAGTRPRGRDGLEDRALEAELRADAKESAEHVMLVDLGAMTWAASAGTARCKVPELMAVERFTRVMHLVSRVTGELAPGEDAFSLLRATFPAGTLTGRAQGTRHADHRGTRTFSTRRIRRRRRLCRLQRQSRHLHRHPHGRAPRRPGLHPGRGGHRRRFRAGAGVCRVQAEGFGGPAGA